MGKELKVGQTVWLVNRLSDKVEKGKLVSPDGASNEQNNPALSIEHESGISIRVPSRRPRDWIFITEEEAQIKLKEKIEADIHNCEEEIKRRRREVVAIASRIWVLRGGKPV